MVFFILLICVVFRDDHMVDYEGYRRTFSDLSLGERYEPGFQLIRYITQYTPWPWFVGSIIVASLSLSIRLKFIYEEVDLFWGAMIVYLSNILVIQDMIAIRAGVASVFLLYALRYKTQGDYKKCLFFLFIATMFHYSALIFGALLFVSISKKRRWLYISMVVGSYLAAIHEYTLGKFFFLIPNQYLQDHYLAHSDKMNIFNLLQIGHLFICLLGWFFVDKLIKKNKNALLYLKIYTIGIVIIVIFSDFVSLAQRFSELFLSVEIIFIPLLFASIYNSRHIQKLALFAYSLVIFYFTINAENYWTE